MFPSMPVVALSANVMAGVIENCDEAGFNSYVSKPVEFKELGTAISALLDPNKQSNYENFIN